MAKDGTICGWNGEWYFGEGGIEGDDIDNGITFIPESQCGQKTVDLYFGVGGPDTDVVTMLIIDPGTLNLQLYVHAVTLMAVSEELTSDGDGSWERVLGVVNTAGLGKRASGQFTEVDLLLRVWSIFRNHKVWSIATLAFLDVECGGELWPHLLFPFEIVLLHRLVVIALTPGAQSAGAKLGKLVVNLPCN